MPIDPTTFFFADTFESDESLQNYAPDYLYPPVLYDYFLPANTHPTQSPHPSVGPISFLSNHSFRVESNGGPGEGENALVLLPPAAECPACIIEETLWPNLTNCGRPQSICDFGQVFARFRAPGETSDWYHVRAWIKVSGKLPEPGFYPPDYPNWATDFDWLETGLPGGFQQSLNALAILMPKEPLFPGGGNTGPYGPNRELLSYRDAVRLEIGGYYLCGGPALSLWWPQNGIIITGDDAFPQLGDCGNPWPVGEWVCVELAVGNVDAVAGTGTLKLWINGHLMWETDWYEPNEVYGGGVGPPIGFAFGSLATPNYFGVPSDTFPFQNTLFWSAPFEERFDERTYGMEARFARIASADGPIGCHTLPEVPPDELPDPDALRCTSADHYGGADVIRGECGRVICNTTGKTRESWETAAAGFPSGKSFWFSWTAPRDGNFIFRTRGSEVFNELSVHRHTGATPPPLLAASDDDDWDPTSSTSAAVEFTAEAGVEYRIRIASVFDGWIILDFGPAKHLIQDDGWSIDESERETRERVIVAGLLSGLAVQDNQIALSPTGAGTAPTMEPLVFGTIS
jgi:hypothetical protein